MQKIPRTMSTQHPDNVNAPFFASGEVLDGEDEVKETFYAYSHLGCEEQLWDCEGKEADQYIVRKLFSSYEQYFKENRIGEDIFLTMRIPNPNVEKSEAKIVLETLESIPRSADLARIFYGSQSPAPINEVALPMTTGAEQPARVRDYYRKFVSGRSSKEISGGFTVRQWVGDFFPKEIRVIPLFEDFKSILNSDRIIREFVSSQKIRDYQRVWFARSDPALNYGSVATVLLLKIAFSRVHEAEKALGVPIYPVLGCGTAPFRGDLHPGNVHEFLEEYSSVQTFTIQSAFKYDYPVEDVRDAIAKLNNSRRKEPMAIDNELELLSIIKKLRADYERDLNKIYPFVAPITRVIPKRRKRKLHIGLFGYSRGEGRLTLPRAIPFCASFYSLGFPPELIGLGRLSGQDITKIERAYPTFLNDLRNAARFLNEENVKKIAPEFHSRIRHIIELAGDRRDEAHLETTAKILETLSHKEGGETLKDLVIRAANQRHFLG